MKLIALPQAPQPAMVHERKDYFTLPQLIDYANAVAEVKLQAANAQIEALRVARDTRYPYYEQVGPVHVVCKCPKCADAAIDYANAVAEVSNDLAATIRHNKLGDMV